VIFSHPAIEKLQVTLRNFSVEEAPQGRKREDEVAKKPVKEHGAAGAQ
jgi:hypothetical protein